MSHYPPPPDYGQGYGSQEQTQQSPYVPPFPNPYLQPSTGHQQNYAYPMASHMAGNEGAYGYNQNIPSAALAPSVPPLPLFQNWNQDTIPLPPYTAPQAPSYNAGYYNNQAYTAAPQQNQQNQVHQPYAPYVKPAEEGELSEGEFEYGNPASSAQPNTYESAQHWNNDGNGYVDTAHRAVYARNQDGPSRAASDYNYGRASPQTRRQESDSYSPYTSPRETDYSPANRDQQYNSNGQGYRPSPPASKRGNQRSFSGGGNQKHPRVKGTPDPYKSDSHANDFHSSKQSQTTAISERSQAQMTPSEVVAPGITFNGERPKAEAELQRYRKEAQAALLQLSEENVHYPTYIAEGFDQGLVGRYFDDLKLPKTSVKEALQVTTVLHVTNGANGTTVAHKTSDTLGQSSKPDAPPVTQIPTKPTAPTKPAAPTEKELQLKQKMEALRKSREERAQKAAAKNNPVSPVATVDKSEPSSKDSVKDKLSTSPVITEPSIAIEPQITQKTPTPSATISVQPTREISLPKRPSSPKEAKPQQPIVPIPAPQAGPVIPGLFLASTAATNSPYSSLQSNARKRPVAADFDVPASFTPKRPFGQSRDDRPLVIDVSEEEDEDEDVAMDLDSQYDQDSPVQPVRKLSETRSTTINNLAPLSDVPSRKLFSTPPVPDTTPPAVQTIAKSTLGKPEDLERKMKEIEEMKKRIADAERRKKAKQSSSGSNTPRRIDNSGNDSNLTNRVAASIQIDRLVTMAENKATADQQKLAEAQAAEVEKAAELKRDEAEQKRLRRERLSQELPRVDAGVQEKQAQMEELQAKMAQIQAEIQKDLEEKRRMIEEQEKLGQEAEGQLQAQKDKLQDLNGQESGSSTAPSRPASVHVPETEDSSKSSSPVAQDQPTQPESLESQIPVVESAPIAPEQEPAKSPPVVVGPASPRDEIEVPQSATQTMEVEQQVATPDEMDAALQEAMRAEVESLEMAGIDVLGVEMEDSYAPDPNQLAPASVSSCVDKTAQSPVASPMLQRKAMEIPDGESDDYEPPEATSSFGAVDDQKDHNEPDEHDVYEPPEALPMDVDLSPKVDPDSPARESSHIDSPPFSPAPPEPVLDVAAQTPNVGLLSTGVNEQDDIESTVPSQSLTLQQPVLENDTEETSNKAIQSFTPYESPLKLFRAYRFHPAFKDEIPGGYRSMTYNHKFDPLKELCRYELAGGICNDVDCDLQHFKNVGLSDNDVLTSLTSHNTFTGEQRTRFVTGLKEVFTGLREKNLDKDFDSIASALVAHRAKFLGDNSKVLPLEGTTI